MASHMASHEVARGVPQLERTLPVPDALGRLLADASLVRGRVMSCVGPAATSLAFASVADAVASGSWLAVVSVPELGVDAALGLGLDLVRVVRVDDIDPARWVDVIAACLDGFELVITVVPRQLSERVWRKVLARVRSKDAVLVTIGEHRVAVGDTQLHTSHLEWTWARAHSHLLARRVHVEVAGRRVPQTRKADLWLPAESGGIELVQTHDYSTVTADNTLVAVADSPALHRQAG